MLLSDGCPNTTEDLRVYESGILDVTRAEGIDLGAKLGLAVEEVSEQVLNFIIEEGRATDPFASSSLSAGANDRRQRGVSDIVLSRQMKRWHAIATIALVYRDAYHNQLNSRYEAQYKDYRRLSQEARDLTLRFGLGVVANPVPRAVKPTLALAASNVAGATYYVRVAWTDASGRMGAASPLTALDSPDGKQIVVQPPVAPSGITGYDVYVGLTEESLAKQTAVPITPAQSLTIAASDIVSGSAPAEGQAPDYYVTGARVLRRG